MSALLKICRVRDVHEARVCAELGADFLGLHAIDRLGSSAVARFSTIVEDLRRYFPETVAVLVSKVESLEECLGYLKATGIRVLQLHRPLIRGEALRLQALALEVLGEPISLIGVIGLDEGTWKAQARLLEDEASAFSYFLIDSSWRGGTGRSASHSVVSAAVARLGTRPTLLAGGITPDNAASLLAQFGVAGVDVQSALEEPRSSRKDAIKVRRMCLALKKPLRQVHWRARRVVSIALAGLSRERVEELALKALGTDVDLVHIDDSDATLVKSFRADAASTVEILEEKAVGMRYDLHLMQSDPTQALARVEEIGQSARSLRAVYVHFDPRKQNLGFVEQVLFGLKEKRIETGIALDASGFRDRTDALNADHPVLAGVKNFSVVCRSAKSSVRDLEGHEALLVRSIRASRARPGLLSLAVDRELTPARLIAFTAARPSHVVSGSFLQEQVDLQAGVSALRAHLRALEEVGGGT